VGSAESADASSGATPSPRQNPANPRSGTGLQHARNPRCGGSRRGGAKPRGRNGKSWWLHDPIGRGNEAVEWTPAGTSEEGNPVRDNLRGGWIRVGGSGSAPGASEARRRCGGGRIGSATTGETLRRVSVNPPSVTTNGGRNAAKANERHPVEVAGNCATSSTRQRHGCRPPSLERATGGTGSVLETP
jgi:hypothetical protein